MRPDKSAMLRRYPENRRVLNSLPGGQSSMNQRNKPDLLWVLVFIFGLGVVTTGYAQGFWERKLDNAYQMPVDASQPPR
ncbi:hypothetical protein ACVWZT_001878 [Pseudomonas sp. TE21394]